MTLADYSDAQVIDFSRADLQLNCASVISR